MPPGLAREAGSGRADGFTSTPTADVDPARGSELAELAASEGSVQVIVGLDTGFRPEGRLSPADARDQRSHIADIQSSVFEELAGTEFDKKRIFTSIPYIALEVSENALATLQRSVFVSSVVEDVPIPTALTDSRKIVGSPAMEDFGYDGSGKMVAVLDTGVETGHSFLSGKVLEEACYTQGDCPNGGSSQTGAGAGVNCTYTFLCTHGTHVAGIVAGENTSLAGVAPDTSLMSVNVFSRVDDATQCGGAAFVPCTLAFNSDIIAGLQRVYDIRATRDFAAVNMSLGGGKFTTTCDTASTAMKAIIDNLRAAGIPTIISSGNNGYRDGIGFPACISTAISVGSTDKQDAVSSFSNIDDHLSLLAPGTLINSSVSGNAFSQFNGTSMAAPHVAGAWALIKEQSPSASVANVLTALQNTGRSITDNRPADAVNGHVAGSVTKSRIRTAAAASVLTGSVPFNSFSSPRVLSGSNAQHYAHTVNASKEVGEPNHHSNAGGASIWYRWTAPSAGSLTISTAGSDFDTLLGVYTGNAVNALNPVASNDDEAPPSVRTSAVSITTSPGTIYQIAVDGFAGSSGATKLQLSFVPETDPPLNPTLSSTSHTVSTWSSDPTIDMSWSGASDASGVDGFSYLFDSSPSSVPPAAKTSEESVSSASSSVLGSGQHYFHLRTVDNAGNWSGAVHLGPFLIDTNPPSSVAMTKPTAKFQKATSVKLAWGASNDFHSGLANYKVHYQEGAYDSPGFGGFVEAATVTSQTHTFAGDFGKTYCFAISPYDNVGNNFSPSIDRCASVPLDDRALTRSAGWTEKTLAGNYQNTHLLSKTKGSSLTLSGVHASQLALLVTKCPSCGSLQLKWNGTALPKAGTTTKTISLVAPRTKKKQLVTFQGFGSEQLGTVTVKVTSANGKAVMVDALGVAKI